jgi:hypothetical protein
LNCSFVSSLPACLYTSVVGKLEPPSSSGAEEYLPVYPTPGYVLGSVTVVSHSIRDVAASQV